MIRLTRRGGDKPRTEQKRPVYPIPLSESVYPAKYCRTDINLGMISRTGMANPDRTLPQPLHFLCLRILAQATADVNIFLLIGEGRLQNPQVGWGR